MQQMAVFPLNSYFQYFILSQELRNNEKKKLYVHAGRMNTDGQKLGLHVQI